MLSKLVITAALAGLAATGCGGTAATSDGTQAAAAPKQTTVKYGQTKTYPDKLAVSVSAPTPYTPSATAATPSGPASSGKYAKLVVTITNGTNGPYNPIQATTTARSCDAEAERVFDAERQINTEPQTAVLPGQRLSYPVVFKVTSPNDVVVQFTPDFMHSPAVFTKE